MKDEQVQSLPRATRATGSRGFEPANSRLGSRVREYCAAERSNDELRF